MRKLFIPTIEFWSALQSTNKCPQCGFTLNGTTQLIDLLEKSVDIACNKCGYEWSKAIPLGDCRQRRGIEDKIRLHNEYVIISKRMHDIYNTLQEIDG